MVWSSTIAFFFLFFFMDLQATQTSMAYRWFFTRTRRRRFPCPIRTWRFPLWSRIENPYGRSEQRCSGHLTQLRLQKLSVTVVLLSMVQYFWLEPSLLPFVYPRRGGQAFGVRLRSKCCVSIITADHSIMELLKLSILTLPLIHCLLFRFEFKVLEKSRSRRLPGLAWTIKNRRLKWYRWQVRTPVSTFFASASNHPTTVMSYTREYYNKRSWRRTTDCIRWIIWLSASITIDRLHN